MAHWKGIGLAVILSTITALCDQFEGSYRDMKLQNDHEMANIFKNLKSKPYFFPLPLKFKNHISGLKMS